MDSIPNSELTIISTAECPYFFLSTCFLNPYTSAIATVMAFSVYRVRNDLINKQRNVSVINFVLVSLVCSVIYYLNSIFLANSLLIPWDFSSLDYYLADISDLIAFFVWAIGKVSFYCALCKYVSNLLSNAMKTQVYSIIKFVLQKKTHFLYAHRRTWTSTRARGSPPSSNDFRLFFTRYQLC